MKKFLLSFSLFLFMFLFVACESSPVNYEVPKLIQKDDWKIYKLKDKDAYEVNKSILLKNILNNPIIQNDSLKFYISPVLITEIKQFPLPIDFEKMIDEILNNCESSCKNKATFKPYELNLTFIPTKEPRKLTKKDIEIAEKNWGFLKSIDEKDFKEEVNKSLSVIEKGENKQFIISIKFLASNSYGTPGKLSATMRYDITNKKLDYHGATED